MTTDELVAALALMAKEARRRDRARVLLAAAHLIHDQAELLDQLSAGLAEIGADLKRSMEEKKP